MVMEFLQKANHGSLVVMAVVILILTSQGQGAVNDSNEKSKDSLVTGIVTAGDVGRIDELMVLKNYERELYIMCIGDFEAKSSFLLLFKKQKQKPTLLLILKVDSCTVNNEEELRQSVVLNSYNSDLTNIEVMVRVRNRGCERYTSVDKRMSPCECREPRLKHRWTKLSETDSKRILEDIRSNSESANHGLGKGNLKSAMPYPIDSMTTEIQKNAEKMAVSQLTATSGSVSVRQRRSPGQVLLLIIAIPVCIVAFIVMAAIVMTVGMAIGGVIGAFVGIAAGIKAAGEATGKIYEGITGD